MIRFLTDKKTERMRELVKVQETLDQVLDYFAGNDIGLIAEHLRTNIDKSKSIVENLLIYSVVRSNLTDKHPIEGVNGFMQTDTELEDLQFYCFDSEDDLDKCTEQCMSCRSIEDAREEQ